MYFGDVLWDSSILHTIITGCIPERYSSESLSSMGQMGFLKSQWTFVGNTGHHCSPCTVVDIYACILWPLFINDMDMEHRSADSDNVHSSWLKKEEVLLVVKKKSIIIDS